MLELVPKILVNFTSDDDNFWLDVKNWLLGLKTSDFYPLPLTPRPYNPRKFL